MVCDDLVQHVDELRLDLAAHHLATLVVLRHEETTRGQTGRRAGTAVTQRVSSCASLPPRSRPPVGVHCEHPIAKCRGRAGMRARGCVTHVRQARGESAFPTSLGRALSNSAFSCRVLWDKINHKLP